MTRRQYWTILGAIAVVAVTWFAVLLLTQRAACERGNDTRVHLQVPPASCSLRNVVVGP